MKKLSFCQINDKRLTINDKRRRAKQRRLTSGAKATTGC